MNTGVMLDAHGCGSWRHTCWKDKKWSYQARERCARGSGGFDARFDGSFVDCWWYKRRGVRFLGRDQGRLGRRSGWPYVVIRRTKTVQMRNSAGAEQPGNPLLNVIRVRAVVILMSVPQVCATSDVVPTYVHRRCGKTSVADWGFIQVLIVAFVQFE